MDIILLAIIYANFIAKIIYYRKFLSKRDPNELFYSMIKYDKINARLVQVLLNKGANINHQVENYTLFYHLINKMIDKKEIDNKVISIIFTYDIEECGSILCGLSYRARNAGLIELEEKLNSL